MRLRSTPQERGNHGQSKNKYRCSLHNDTQTDHIILPKSSFWHDIEAAKSF